MEAKEITEFTDETRYTEYGQVRFEQRFVRTNEAHVGKMVQVLQQQCFDRKTLNYIWLDVPCVNEEFELATPE